MSELADRIVNAVKSGEIKDRRDLQNFKLKLSGILGLGNVPPNSEILAEVPPEDRELLLPFLIRKPMRTASGTAAVAVMSSPYPCPHGKCIFCPGGTDFGTPQSYTGKEPAARRAGRNDYDPFAQVTDRIGQLEAIGHDASSVDLIIMGGTFPCREPEYKETFLRRCFDALNGKDSGNIREALDLNENADYRCAAVAMETRPDRMKKEDAEDAMRLGATRFELGVQILDDGILRSVNRGHTVQDIVDATRVCKEAGLPVCYHIMPGLPGSDPEKDLKCFERVFSDPDFRPDSLKFYTTLVIGGTTLYEMWRKGEYEPYGTETAVKLLSEMKTTIPEYVRVQRIQRDIPVPEIAAGITKSNLRQLVSENMAAEGKKCRCIRCREVGHTGTAPRDVSETELKITEYEASGAKEFFIAYEAEDSLIGFVRLRADGSGVASVRELKVSGSQGDSEGWQNRGYAEKLMEQAEKKASENGAAKVRVTCGPGTREFFRNLGYSLEFPYMSKRIIS